jgi:hypothetical protein
MKTVQELQKSQELVRERLDQRREERDGKTVKELVEGATRQAASSERTDTRPVQ